MLDLAALALAFVAGGTTTAWALSLAVTIRQQIEAGRRDGR